MQLTISAPPRRYNFLMETIYVDSLFALNMIIDYFLLLCSAKVCGVPFRRTRYVLAAALGAAWAVASVLPDIDFISSAPMKLALAGFMSLIAFGGERRLLRCFIVFLAVSAAFGGAVWGASMLAGASVTGRLYIPVSLRVLTLSFAVCYFAVSLVFRRTAKKAERQLVRLAVELGGRTAAFTALRDTGNGLYDPISGCAVAVAEASSLLPLFPAEAAVALLSPDPSQTVEAFSSLPGFEKRFRLVPYSAVGTSFGLLPAFRPDCVRVDGAAEKGLIIALTQSRLSEGGEYSAII
ncbi:MAG: sigma-E processing peptidase SpoIIGA [Clostridia bacterium]|nr:sigma-E processing peptidase SpoIIGA [Clostridia bacterium]